MKLLCVLFLVILVQNAPPALAARRLKQDLAAIEEEVYYQINEYRESIGLAPLIRDEVIDEQCRYHSEDMASGAVPFSHEGMSDRIAAIGYGGAAAENVAYNSFDDPATVAVEGWLNSPGHLTNIQGDYSLTGIGAAVSADGSVYFTQIFIS